MPNVCWHLVGHCSIKILRNILRNIKEQKGVDRREQFKHGGKNDQGIYIPGLSGLLWGGVGRRNLETCPFSLFSLWNDHIFSSWGPFWVAEGLDAWRSLLVAFLVFLLPLCPLIRVQDGISWKIKLLTPSTSAPIHFCLLLPQSTVQFLKRRASEWS